MRSYKERLMIGGVFEDTLAKDLNFQNSKKTTVPEKPSSHDSSNSIRLCVTTLSTKQDHGKE
jgi:hypothetical protein